MLSASVKALIAASAVIVVGGGSFVYLTRPVSAPTQDFTAPAPAPEPAPVPAEEAEKPPVVAADVSVKFTIAAAESSATFEIDEILRDEPFHVVGTTNQVAGEVMLNTVEPSKSTVGTILVNARTLATDSKSRDGMIGRFILKSEENEFIKFEAKKLSEMPATIVPGTAFSFKITGTLTVAGVAKDVTFDATATLVDANTLNANAQTTLKYADFGIVIPTVPAVASVSDDVTLKINLVARATAS